MSTSNAGKPGTRSRGRAKSADKRRAIVDAARELFLDQGFEQTTTDAVAVAAGVSKATLYNHFGSKGELFEAIVDQRSARLEHYLEPLVEPSCDPADDLLEFAAIFQRVVLTPRVRRWDRLVIAEAERHPELARLLFKAGPAEVHARLADYIRLQTEAEQLDVDDPALAAEHFLGLIMGLEMIRGQMGSMPKRTRTHQANRCREAVIVFMARYGRQR